MEGYYDDVSLDGVTMPAPEKGAGVETQAAAIELQKQKQAADAQAQLAADQAQAKAVAAAAAGYQNPVYGTYQPGMLSGIVNSWRPGGGGPTAVPDAAYTYDQPVRPPNIFEYLGGMSMSGPTDVDFLSMQNVGGESSADAFADKSIPTPGAEGEDPLPQGETMPEAPVPDASQEQPPAPVQDEVSPPSSSGGIPSRSAGSMPTSETLADILSRAGASVPGSPSGPYSGTRSSAPATPTTQYSTKLPSSGSMFSTYKAPDLAAILGGLSRR